MTLSKRIEMLEERANHSDRFKIIVGPSDTLQEQARIFKDEHPEFKGTLILVTDIFKNPNSGR